MRTYTTKEMSNTQSPIKGVKNLRDALPRNVSAKAVPKHRKIEIFCSLGARIRVAIQRRPVAAAYIARIVVTGGNVMWCGLMPDATNDSATRPAGHVDCNRSAPAGFAAAR